MLVFERIPEQRPERFVLPAGIGDHPVEVVEQADQHQARVSLRRGEACVDGEAVFADEVGQYGFAIADGFAVVHDVRELRARRGGSVKDVFVREIELHEFQEREDFEPVAVVVGRAE